MQTFTLDFRTSPTLSLVRWDQNLKRCRWFRNPEDPNPDPTEKCWSADVHFEGLKLHAQLFSVITSTIDSYVRNIVAVRTKIANAHLF